MKMISDFKNELTEDLNSLRQSKITRKTANLFRSIAFLIGRITRVTVELLFLFLKKNLNLVAVFAGTLIIILLLYFDFPFYLKGLTGILLFIVGSIGRSFLDYKYDRFETRLEDQILSIARRQVTLGIADGASADETDPVMSQILDVAMKSGMGIIFERKEKTQKGFNYFFSFKNESVAAITDSFQENLRRVLGLRVSPLVFMRPEGMISIELPKEIFPR
jgi:hypothetical protein